MVSEELGGDAILLREQLLVPREEASQPLLVLEHRGPDVLGDERRPGEATSAPSAFRRLCSPMQCVLGLPVARHGAQHALVPRMHDAEPHAVGAEVLARAVDDVHEPRVDNAGQVEPEQRGEARRVGRRRVGIDGLGIDLVADDVQVALAAEPQDLSERFRGLLGVSRLSITRRGGDEGAHVAFPERVMRTTHRSAIARSGSTCAEAPT